MLKRRHWFILFSCVFVACPLVLGQPAKPAHRPSKPAETEVTDNLRSESVALVRTFAERAIRFDDVSTKIITLSSIAGVLWKDDSAYAARLLTNSLEAVERCPAERCNQKQKVFLRNIIISRAARLDSTLTQEMVTSIAERSDSDGGAAKALHLLYAAAALLDSSPAKAINLAEQSLRFGVSKELRGFLFRLRTINPGAADSLFLKALFALKTQSFVDANVLMHLGAYLYKSPNIPATESAVEMTVVGGQLTINLAVERPNISEMVAKAYLGTVVDLLSKPIADPEQAKLVYAIGHQLYPKIQRDLPDRAAQMTAILNSRKPSSEQSFDSGSRESEDSKDRKMDSDYLADAQKLFQASEFEGARIAANKIADETGKVQTLKIIKFYEALKKIDGDLEGALALVGPLGGGKERTLLLLTIAQKQMENQQRAMAGETITAALKDIREMPASDQSALLLVAAYQMSGLDLLTAKAILTESLKKFDDIDLENLMESAWTITIVLDEIPHRLALGNTRIERKPSNLIRVFLTADRDWTVAAVLGMDKEKVLGPLMVSLAQTILPPLSQKETKPSK